MRRAICSCLYTSSRVGSGTFRQIGGRGGPTISSSLSSWNRFGASSFSSSAIQNARARPQQQQQGTVKKKQPPLPSTSTEGLTSQSRQSPEHAVGPTRATSPSGLYFPPEHPINKTWKKGERDPNSGDMEQMFMAMGLPLKSHLSTPRIQKTHGILVATLQFRSYNTGPMDFFIDFSRRVAAELGMVTSFPTKLPTRTELQTVIKGPFAHKKSQQNFWRKTHKRSIKIWDSEEIVIERWLTYLRKWAMPGVGMKAQLFRYRPLGWEPNKYTKLTIPQPNVSVIETEVGKPGVSKEKDVREMAEKLMPDLIREVEEQEAEKTGHQIAMEARKPKVLQTEAEWVADQKGRDKDKAKTDRDKEPKKSEAVSSSSSSSSSSSASSPDKSTSTSTSSPLDPPVVSAPTPDSSISSVSQAIPPLEPPQPQSKSGSEFVQSTTAQTSSSKEDVPSDPPPSPSTTPSPPSQPKESPAPAPAQTKTEMAKETAEPPQPQPSIITASAEPVAPKVATPFSPEPAVDAAQLESPISAQQEEPTTTDTKTTSPQAPPHRAEEAPVSKSESKSKLGNDISMQEAVLRELESESASGVGSKRDSKEEVVVKAEEAEERKEESENVKEKDEKKGRD